MMFNKLMMLKRMMRMTSYYQVFIPFFNLMVEKKVTLIKNPVYFLKVTGSKPCDNFNFYVTIGKKKPVLMICTQLYSQV
jgi:hypothetical protein